MELQLGLVMSFFRGALCKPTDEGPRKLKSTRPSVHALTPAMCARVRLLRLTQAGNHRYWCSSFSQMLALDPLGTVVGEIRVQECSEVDGRKVFLFSDRTMKAFKKWMANPGLFENKKAPEPAEEVAAPVQSSIYNFADFNWTKQGAANIREFLQKLPLLYDARENPILENGRFCYGSKLLWDEIVHLGSRLDQTKAVAPLAPSAPGNAVPTSSTPC